MIEAVRHARAVNAQIARASTLSEIELYSMAKELAAPVDLLRETAKLGRLPVVMFSAGGIATPADAALMMKLGMDGVFVCVYIFLSLASSTPRAEDLLPPPSIPLFYRPDFPSTLPVRSGSGIFKSSNPELLAKAIVEATTHWNDPVKLAEVSTGLGAGMKGENLLGKAAGKEMTADRGY